MMRSLYSGVSGLKNHNIRMDAIGHNIANVNTTGYKKQRVNFQEMISQTLEGASKPTNEKGGVNPKQVGLGMTIASIDTITRQGSLQTTAKNTDVSISGEGFFILKKGENTFYTRAGNFGVDQEYNLVNPANGFKVQGWNAQKDNNGNYTINSSASIEDLKIPINEKFEAKATSEVKLKCNLNSASKAVAIPSNPTTEEASNGQVHITSIDVYDSEGNTHKMELRFVKVSTNKWQVNANISGQDPNPEAPQMQMWINSPDARGQNAGQSITLEFDDKGALLNGQDVSPNPNTSLAKPSESMTATLRFKPEGALPQDITIQLGSVGLYDGVTQQQSESTTKFVKQNGHGLGYLENFVIDQSGIITGQFSNGESREIGQIGMSTFINASGLERSGDTNFLLSNNSGLPNVGTPGSQGKGSLQAGTLEMSNVDIAEEFTDMIVAQRGFQANTRTISTADQMLQELLMLKR